MTLAAPLARSLARGGALVSGLHALFASDFNEGFWFQPSHIETLAQDAAGTTPVTAAGQQVGLIRDLSGCNNHASQSLAAARPTYQIDSNGRPYLLFDGVDDRMTINDFALGAAGRTVISAIQKNTDATLGTVLEHRPLWTTPGGVAHFAPGGNGAATYGTRAHTSSAQSLLTSPASFAAPSKVVLTSLAVTGSHIMRINGEQVASEAPAGTMAALSAGMMIGARDNAGLFANMRLYGLFIIDRVLSAPELTRAERFFGARLGVSIP